MNGAAIMSSYTDHPRQAIEPFVANPPCPALTEGQAQTDDLLADELATPAPRSRSSLRPAVGRWQACLAGARSRECR
jgi:hypothetical protein